jgi:hypothetical protein
MGNCNAGFVLLSKVEKAEHMLEEHLSNTKNKICVHQQG